MVLVTALCQQEKILLVIFLNLQQQTVGFSFFLDKKRNKKIKDEGCTSPSSGSYDGHWCYCSINIYGLLPLAFSQSINRTIK
jgi:hypothetical protein